MLHGTNSQSGRPGLYGRRIRQIFRENEYDVIHFHNISLAGGPGVLSHGNGIKLYSAHEHWLVCPTHVLWRATFLATPLLLPSTWIYVLSFVMALTFVIRTALEDRTLQSELTGYVEYAARVRFRLVPGVW